MDDQSLILRLTKRVKDLEEIIEKKMDVPFSQKNIKKQKIVLSFQIIWDFVFLISLAIAIIWIFIIGNLQFINEQIKTTSNTEHLNYKEIKKTSFEFGNPFSASFWTTKNEINNNEKVWNLPELIVCPYPFAQLYAIEPHPFLGYDFNKRTILDLNWKPSPNISIDFVYWDHSSNSEKEIPIAVEEFKFSFYNKSMISKDDIFAMCFLTKMHNPSVSEQLKEFGIFQKPMIKVSYSLDTVFASKKDFEDREKKRPTVALKVLKVDRNGYRRKELDSLDIEQRIPYYTQNKTFHEASNSFYNLKYGMNEGRIKEEVTNLIRPNRRTIEYEAQFIDQGKFEKCGKLNESEGTGYFCDEDFILKLIFANKKEIVNQFLELEWYDVFFEIGSALSLGGTIFVVGSIILQTLVSVLFELCFGCGKRKKVVYPIISIQK